MRDGEKQNAVKSKNQSSRYGVEKWEERQPEREVIYSEIKRGMDNG